MLRCWILLAIVTCASLAEQTIVGNDDMLSPPEPSSSRKLLHYGNDMGGLDLGSIAVQFLNMVGIDVSQISEAQLNEVLMGISELIESGVNIFDLSESDIQSVMSDILLHPEDVQEEEMTEEELSPLEVQVYNFLVENGVDLNLLTPEELILFIQEIGALDDQLADNGVNPMEVTTPEMTELFEAAAEDGLQTIAESTLIQNGIDPSQVPPQEMMGLMHNIRANMEDEVAAEKGQMVANQLQEEAFRLLVQEGADPSSITEDDILEVIQLLSGSGAQPRPPQAPQAGLLPPETLQLLMENGINPENLTPDEVNELLMATAEDNAQEEEDEDALANEAIQLLIQNGVDPNSITPEDVVQVMAALTGENPMPAEPEPQPLPMENPFIQAAIQLLARNGMDPNQVTEDEIMVIANSLMEEQTNQQNEQVAGDTLQLLIDNGIDPDQVSPQELMQLMDDVAALESESEPEEVSGYGQLEDRAIHILLQKGYDVNQLTPELVMHVMEMIIDQEQGSGRGRRRQRRKRRRRRKRMRKEVKQLAIQYLMQNGIDPRQVSREVFMQIMQEIADNLGY